MKIKKNYIAASLLILFALSINAFAQDDKAKEGNIDVSMTFVSGYLWRGFDLYAGKFAQDKKKQAAFNFIPSLAPDITFSSPTLEGLSFNIWAQYPLSARNEVELKDASGNVTGTEDGLNKIDEVDYTVGYEHKSKFGTFSANYIIFSFPMAGASYSELGFGFSFEPVENLSLAISHNVAAPGYLYNAGETYSTIGIGYTIAAGSIEIAPSVTVGYWDIPVENVNGLGSADTYKIENSVPVEILNGDNYTHVDFGLDASISVNEKLAISFGALASYRLLTDNQKSGLDPEDSTSATIYDFPALIAQFSFGVAYSL